MVSSGGASPHKQPPLTLSLTIMKISRTTVLKSGRLSATVTLSGAELSWLHYLSAIALEAGDTLGHGYGTELMTAADLRSLTERLDPVFLEVRANCTRQKASITETELLRVVREVKADHEKKRSEALA